MLVNWCSSAEGNGGFQEDRERGNGAAQTQFQLQGRLEEREEQAQELQELER